MVCLRRANIHGEVFLLFLRVARGRKGVYNCSIATAHPKRAVVRSDATDVRNYLKMSLQ